MEEQKDDIRYKFSKHLFWDIDIEDLDMEKHGAYVLEKVLEFGRMNDWLLVNEYYDIDELRRIAVDMRCMSPKALSFMSIITHTPEKQFRCYKELQSPNRHWHF